MIVLDANILIRAVLGRKVLRLIEEYSAKGVRFFVPDTAFHDAERYLPVLLKKFASGKMDYSGALSYLLGFVEIVHHDLYSAFEIEARKRLRGRDEDDWPVLASALGLGCGVWTEDQDFFGIGVAVWTTSRIEIFLASEAKNAETEE